MLINIFSSVQKPGTFIFLPFVANYNNVENYGISEIDSIVKKFFIGARLVMSLDLNKKKLAFADNQKVLKSIEELGYYLQIINENVYHNNEEYSNKI